ncbi:hypothetical protein ACFFRR_003586 [Megaselia abdita]
MHHVPGILVTLFAFIVASSAIICYSCLDDECSEEKWVSILCNKTRVQQTHEIISLRFGVKSRPPALALVYDCVDLDTKFNYVANNSDNYFSYKGCVEMGFNATKIVPNNDVINSETRNYFETCGNDMCNKNITTRPPLTTVTPPQNTTVITTKPVSPTTVTTPIVNTTVITTKPPGTTKPTTPIVNTTVITTKNPGTTKPTTPIVNTTLPTTKPPGTTKPTTPIANTTLPTTKPPGTTKPTTPVVNTTLPTTKPPATTLPPTTPIVNTTLPTKPPTTPVPTTLPPTTLPPPELKCYFCSNEDCSKDPMPGTSCSREHVDKSHEKLSSHFNKKSETSQEISAFECLSISSEITVDGTKNNLLYKGCIEKGFEPCALKYDDNDSEKRDHCRTCKDNLCNSASMMGSGIGLLVAVFVALRNLL